MAVESAAKSTVPAKQSEGYLDTFTKAVIKEFSTMAPSIDFSPFQRRLANHLALKIDASLKTLDLKRSQTPAKRDNTPITWENVNLDKLAIDAVDRIDLGLDALIPNHIHVIPYFNGRLKKYDLDLRVGYVGKDHYYRKMAIEEPLNVIYELVHETDYFLPKKKSIHNDVESYEFEIKQPFKRGAVVGGFGYIEYADQKKNKLILVSDEEFDKARKRGNVEFWGTEEKPGDWEDRMQYKTVVTRTVTKLSLDPEKIGRAFMAVQAQEDAMDATLVGADIEEKANKGDVIDITDTKVAGTGQAEPPVPENGKDPTAAAPLVVQYQTRMAEAFDYPTLNNVRAAFLDNANLSDDEKKALQKVYQAEAKRLQQPKKETVEEPNEEKKTATAPF